MATLRVLTAGARHLHHRTIVVHSFITSLAPSLAVRPAAIHSRCAFATSSRHGRSENTSIGKGQDEDQYEEAPATAEEAEAKVEQDAWYMDVEEQKELVRPVENPFAERQRIPELPHNAPPLMSALLQHISVDIGLDYVSIVDLRKLDPPPALGSNLLMIFGTARSERHLNVAADRLCRWLRSNYGLRPFADGLLGRNELKLKLKRKARRSRMLGAAGAVDVGNYDDGIGTGWICVNIGSVPGNGSEAENAVEAEEEPLDDFVGFGASLHEPKIVVQMMTEEKRGELELETLWVKAAERSEKRAQRAREAAESGQTVPEEAEEVEFDVDPRQARSAFARASGSPVSRVSTGHQQRRAYNSLTGVLPKSPSMPPNLQPNPRPAQKVEHKRLEFDVSVIQKQVAQTQAQRDSLLDGEESHEAAATSDRQSLERMERLLDQLYEMDDAQALKALGTGQDHPRSSEFLQHLDDALPVFMHEPHWHVLIQLHSHAIHLAHPGYTKRGLVDLVNEMQATVSAVPEKTLLSVLETILLAPHPVSTSTLATRDSIARNPEGALRQDLSSALHIVELMHNLGYDATSDVIFGMLHDSFANPSFYSVRDSRHVGSQPVKGWKRRLPSQRDMALDEAVVARFHARLRRALFALKPLDIGHALYERMMETHASRRQWGPFWELWHAVAQNLLNRTPRMYFLCFHHLAEQGDIAGLRKNLRTWVPVMEQERPPVQVTGDVAVAIYHGLVVAELDTSEDPFFVDLLAKASAAANQSLMSEWKAGKLFGEQG